MNLPYAARLACLLTVMTGVACALLECALAAGAGWLGRRLRGARARLQERALFAAQVLPVAVAGLLAMACCLPEYLRNEPEGGTERVSGWCLMLAGLAAVWFGTAAARGMRTALRTMRFARACRRAGAAGRHDGIPVIRIAEPGRTVALLGVGRPVILVSEEARAALGDAALTVALDHELAHAKQRDNWKLLATSFLPRLPWKASRTRMRAWQEAAEWAADEDAARGSRARRLLLAEALVRVARQGGTAGLAMVPLSCEGAGLAARVERLVRPADMGRAWKAAWALAPGAAVLLAGLAAAVNCSPWVYELGERILHLG